MERSAVIDASGIYRYSLKRTWDKGLGKVAFIMLNPSTADHEVDDPTIRRCIGFAKSWGFGGIEVVNLFALRATNPDELKQANDPIGPDNDFYIVNAMLGSRLKVAAWGSKGILMNRNDQALKLLKGYLIHCLEETQKGYPKHPLYIKGNTLPSVYRL